MMTVNEIKALPSWDEVLKQKKRPVWVYGMGNGCEKLLRVFEERGVVCAGIAVSDDRASRREFCGFPLVPLSRIEGEDVSIAVAFGTTQPEVMARIDTLAERHTLVYPELSVAGEGSFERSVLSERYEDMERVCSLLRDETSRRIFDNVLRFKITGDIRFLSEYSDEDEISRDILRLGEDEIYCDLGAYNGDTVLDFLARTGGRYRHIYAVEPSVKNFQKCLRSLGSLDSITLINAAASDRDGEACFSTGAGRQQALTGSGRRVSVRSLDSILGGSPCTCIKYDVEGEDSPALLGSAETIRRFCPKIRTGIYHRPYDILDIPLLIDSLRPGYSFYIRRRNCYPAWDVEALAVL
ncbi:MAG: FkbM family methyltransferase [Ruminococcus sp.]|nr:FkbM family methyltransferase [Ruminococcus sp.]